MGESAALQKDGVERDLQEALAAAPEALGEPLTLVRREWQTEIGPVDLMCHDEAGEWVAVEVKRIGTIEAVEQLTRYLDFIRRDPAKAGCRGILVAQRLKPQAVALAESRDIRCVTVDLAVLRGEREPDLTLFARRSQSGALPRFELDAAATPARTPSGCAYAAEPRRSITPSRVPARSSCSRAFSAPTPPPITAVAGRAAAICSRTSSSVSKVRGENDPTWT